MFNRFIFKKIIVLIVVLLVLVVGKTYINNSIEAVSPNNVVEKEINIPNGTSVNNIAKILKENNLIKSSKLFVILSKVNKTNKQYKAGIYNLNTSMNQEQIMNELVKGGKLKKTVTFTIPEGFEIDQIAERLNKVGLVDKDRFIRLTTNVSLFKDKYQFLKSIPEGQSLQGFLYPDTYEVYKDATEEEIIKKMLDNFKKIYTKDIQEKASELGMNTNQVVTLASIIEREAMVESERKIMSGVFHNRLKINMPLQSCATVQYILGERKPVLSNKDVEIDSEYNTYKNLGLPPAPIASPGKASIEAAVSPEKVDYLFFVRTGSDGSHTFSKSYEEHLKAKNAK